MKKKSSTQLNLLFFLIHLLAYAYLFHFNDWNSNSRFGLTMAMLERGTLSIDAYHDSPDWQTGDKSLFNGHYYSDKAPGTSFAGALLFLPIFEICQRSGLVLTPTLTKIIIPAQHCPACGSRRLVGLSGGPKDRRQDRTSLLGQYRHHPGQHVLALFHHLF